jgi:Lrp/AsnC family transcriptional regulator for asnA, asnC and gidA
MTLKIDQLNLKILRDLLSDGRKPLAQIAQENYTSKEVVTKRVKQLKSKGVILGFTTQNSIKCFDANFVANILIYVQRGKMELAVQEVRKIPNVVHAYPVAVKQAVLVEVSLKNITELDTAKKLIHELPFVLGTDVTIWTGIRTIPENLSIFDSLEPVKKESPTSIASSASRNGAEPEMDDVDKAIIEKLAINGRMPFADIAEPIGVSTETVLRRYEKLKETRNLKVVAQIDPKKIGYYAFAIFNLSFSQEALADNIDRISSTPDVNRVIKSAGYQDLTFTLMIRDINHFIEMQDRMVVLPNITKIEVRVARMLCPWPLQREIISTF